MKNNFLQLFVLICFFNLLIFQTVAQVLTGNPVQPAIPNQNPFFDASTNHDPSVTFENNNNKGLVFPRTDLTQWEFTTDLLDGSMFPTAFDGMIVYNVGTGTTLSGQGQVVSVIPGFYYFYNPSGVDDISNGQWMPLSSASYIPPQGTDGQTMRHDGTDWVGNDILFNNGINIGIGETSPTGKLHISVPGAWAGAAFTGTGLNDLSVNSSGYNTSGATHYAVRIQNAGPNPNIIEISNDGGNSWSAPMAITPNIDMGFGVYISFAQTGGHTYDDLWEFTVNESFFDVFIVKDNSVGVGTDAPQANFHTVGTVRHEGLNTGTQTNTLMIDNNGDLSTRTLNNVAFDGYTETDPTWTGNANTTDTIYRTGNVGIGTSTPSALLHTNGTGTGQGNVLFTGSYKSSSPGDPPVSGAGTRMMWYPDKAAFRAGRVLGAFWDKDSVGNYSFATGYDTKAKGFSSVALCQNSVASGYASIAIGRISIALGDYATAIGNSSSASANNATAIGLFAMADGYASMALGYTSLASGGASTALGFSATASADYATAIGNSTVASGNSSTAMGIATSASGDFSTAMGSNTTAASAYETVMGSYSATYSGDASNWVATDRLFVIGNGTSGSARSNALTILKNGKTGIGTFNPLALLHVNDSATGGGNVLFTGEFKGISPGNPPVSGAGTRMMWYPDKASFRAGTADGPYWDRDSIGWFSVAFGINSMAKGAYSTATGTSTIASGGASMAMGYFTMANGDKSTALGSYTTAVSESETVIGSYNTTYSGNATSWVATDRLFVVGNGTSGSARSNALTILKNGKTGIGTFNPLALLHVNDSATGGGNVLFTGEFKGISPGNPPVSGAGTRMMWYPDKASFRAGTADGPYWDRDSIGWFSVAFGINSMAKGAYSTATGTSTIASGGASMAMGYFTIANGDKSTALGSYTTAVSESETVIGSYNTTYSGNATSWVATDRLFVVGNGTSGSARSNALTILKNGKTGIGTFAPMALLHVNDSATGGGNVLFTGNFKSSSPGSPPISGTGTRMMWYPDKAAFRAGYVPTTNWDKDSIGDYSFATGYNTKAIGFYATAMGAGTKATNYYAFAIGVSTTASASSSTAMGNNTIASGSMSFANGNVTVASGTSSTAMGESTLASGDVSTAMGKQTIAPSGNEMVIGRYNTTYTAQSSSGWVSTDRLFVIGNGLNDLARSNAFTVLKSGNIGIGTDTPDALLHTYSTAIGGGNVLFEGSYRSTPGNPPVTGSGTRMMWYPDKAAFRVGYVSGTQWDKDSIGAYSLAMGYNSKAKGASSIALGYNNSSNNNYSVAIGYNNAASSNYAMAIGNSTIAQGYMSNTFGTNLTAFSGYESVFGRYNTEYTANSPGGWDSDDRIFVVGNGQGNSTRSNALTILKNGKVGIGTDTPLELIHLRNTSGHAKMRIQSTDLSVIDFYNNTSYVAGIGVSVSQGHFFIYNGGNVSVKNGNLGINNIDPGQKLDITGGNGRVQTGYSWLTNSDARYKTNITSIENALGKIANLRGVRYDLIQDSSIVQGHGKHIGFIAQELEIEFPEFVVTEENGYKSVAYDKMTAVLLQAVNEQQDIIKTLQEDILQLNQMLEQQQTQISNFLNINALQSEMQVEK
ncbi:MAG: tail fiber domain-containing protein [Bacteroidales bacterium]|nr:tail fiber domain-containing protein [Bacteroidales bacterium]